jgi:hypothetical protein
MRSMVPTDVPPYFWTMSKARRFSVKRRAASRG